MILELLAQAKSYGLTPAQAILYLALEEILQPGTLVQLTCRNLAEATGLSQRWVKKALRDLECRGLVQRKINNLFQKRGTEFPGGEQNAPVGNKIPRWGTEFTPPPAHPSPFAPPLGIPPYNPPTLPTPYQTESLRPVPAGAHATPGGQAQPGAGVEREGDGDIFGEILPVPATATAPKTQTRPSEPQKRPKFPFVTQGGISLPPTAQNRVKGHFTPEERDFLKVYGKQPLTNDAFNTFVTAFSEAVQDVGLQRLIECARMEVENVRAENGGSSQKLRRPEVFLSDLAYRDWLSKLPAAPNQPTASTDAYMRYLDTLDLGL